MKIAIIGTRGIPNEYGGFEQFAEHLSLRLAEKKHTVSVYNPHYHKYSENTYNDVNIVKIKCSEKYFGGAAHFIYDYLCYKHAIKQDAEIILVCGYGTSAPALALINKRKSKVFTNMDGFEWKRAKYNVLTKLFLKWSEKIAVSSSHSIIADHRIIQEYYQKKYENIPVLITYGAEIPLSFNISVIDKYGLTKNKYFLVVARDEPENQIELIIQAFIDSKSNHLLCIVTNAPRLTKKHKENKKLLFIEKLFETGVLNNLRHYSIACIHGHTVGGTNPSLLEAMAAQANIIAHDNLFHREILYDNAQYFKSLYDLSVLFQNSDSRANEAESLINNNLSNIKENYSWDLITKKYIELFES